MCALLLLLACTQSPEIPAVPLGENSTLTLASVKEGQSALARSDLYLESLSDLERQIRLQSEQLVSREQFLEHLQQQVLAWDQDEQQRLLTIVASLQERMAEFDLPLPEQLLLVKTTGQDESGAAYTRGNAIVFSRRRMQAKDSTLERLLAHELFHVLSRHDERLRRELYAIIGFHPCDPIELPAELAARRITNPDAPSMDYYISVEHQGRMLDAVPILLCDRAEFDPRRKSLFDYLQFRLLAVHQREGKWQALLEDGEPILIEGRNNESYREQIGDNTNYIIHADEILADNFVHLVMKTKYLKSPEIVEQMRAVLKRKGE